MKAKLIRTARNTKEYWNRKNDVIFSEKNVSRNKLIKVDTSKTFQEHMGFGGAFTEAAAYTLSEVSKEIRDEAINAYFDKEIGLGYNLGRVHIHSCDFALGNYTYIEEGDKELNTFDMSHEDKWVIPLIKDSEKVANEKFTILASPWSPPAFMKDNNEMNYGGKLLDEYKESWARYYVKFIEGMKERDVDIWGVSVQNEPAATQTWDSCIYTAEDERDFVRDYLGPEFDKADMKDKKILIWDHNRDIIVDRVIPALMDKEASKYIWGVGNHWYVSEEFSNLSKVHDLFPDKHILFTEGCVEYSIYGNEPGWKNGEHYGRNIIGDFNNWSRGWIDWNLYLNEIGGPNHVGNYCEAPIMVDRQQNKLVYNTSYYYIGHFSKYIKPGAKRLQTTTTTEKNGIFSVSYKNPNGDIIIVVQNQGWIGEVSLIVDNKAANVSLPNNSISTFIIEKE